MIVVNGRFLVERQTGVQRFATQIVKELAQLRNDVLVVAPRRERELAIDGVRVQQFGARNPLLWEQVDLPAWLRRRGAPLLVNLANRAPITYRNQISALHDLIPVRVQNEFSWRFRMQFRAIAWLGVVKGSRRILTVSDFSRREILDHYGLGSDEVVVVPNAADESWSDSVSEPAAQETGRPFVLAFGRVGGNRNTRCSVDAIRSLGGRCDLDLVFVGSPDPALVEAARDLGDRCRFMGRVTDAELVALYKSATCFIAPSLYEGFDLPPLEAQRAGTAVLASDIAVHHEVLGDGAAYFDPRKPELLTGLIERLCRDHRELRDLERRALANAHRFDWRSSAAVLNGTISEMVQ